jgi:hypothetical protein
MQNIQNEISHISQNEPLKVKIYQMVQFIFRRSS